MASPAGLSSPTSSGIPRGGCSISLAKKFEQLLVLCTRNREAVFDNFTDASTLPALPSHLFAPVAGGPGSNNGNYHQRFMGSTHRPNMTTNQSVWPQLGGKASRRSKVIFGILILFLVSWAFILNSDWNAIGAGLSVPGLHGQSANQPANQLAPEPEPKPLSAVLSPNEKGVLLSAGMPIFTSPRGLYTLVLQDDGDLVLNRMNADGTSHPVWWTGTGDRHNGGHTLIVEKQKDHFRIAVNAFLKNAWTTVWHSDLVPGCEVGKGQISGRNESSHWLQLTGSLAMVPGQVELSDQGRLSIAGLCDLYVSPKEREKERTLAVIVTGLYRTSHVTCKTHMEHLVANNSFFSRIDVFAYVLFEPEDIDIYNRTEDSIRAELRKCYGLHLRSMDVMPVTREEEDYPGGEKAMEATMCGNRLQRLNNQLKTISFAAKQWSAWSIANGYIHDTVLRLRPDTTLRARPNFKSLEELGSNTLVLPHPHGEHYFYCARMRGQVGVGPTDQVAYGSALAMSHWLYMYDNFHQMVELAGSPSGPAMRDFSGCEVMPLTPLARDCPTPAPCSIECLVAWYLDARGVDFRIEWGWDHGLLRWKDIEPVGAEAEWMANLDGGGQDQDDRMTGP
ncbi:uncharacterized protein LY79DRAFT_96733 [Colletotrichum navitas]|uniref:Uncharacterized protein n=1 Tax=Colletotrichum navitas TaxID=681940 RepID=A0AAD8PL69_9PEZI|nr:uncharacterized protein LY79DRAFT_96733 [Colletotrichum navitas]KAK1566384.1 hypothetical protein LY79DRAFT_96733 [Colletotrichum navitas]